MNNKDTARLLYEISRLLELKNENTFKIRAYDNAARTIESLNEELHDIIAADQLGEVPGIGKGLADKLKELDSTGKLQYYEDLKSEFPATLFELFRVPNLGPKKIKKLYDDLGIGSLRELEYACLENRLLDLKGFGKKTQEKLLEGIKLATSSDGRHLLGKILPFARELLEYLRASKAIERVEIAGSARRRKEVIHDLDFVASSTKPGEASKHFLKMPYANSIIAQGDTKTSVKMDRFGLQIDLRVVAPSEFACTLHHFTGSKEHNVAMRTHAKRLGYKISEYGIQKEGSTKNLVFKTEEDIYKFFGMDYVPPEMRENFGEIETAMEHKIPKLVEHSDIKGILHVHSVWSDGHNTLDEMIGAAKERGYQYVGISEHSQAAAYAHGLDAKRLEEQRREIETLRKKHTGIRILQGIEADILSDGSVDLGGRTLGSLDFVIASVHSGFRMERKEMTQRICKALEDPVVDVLGHPTGRILLGRKGYDVDLEQVFKTAAKNKKSVEINSSVHRLDLDWTFVKRAAEMGILLSINPDAHRISELDTVELGVGIARKGWATPNQILNTREWEEIEASRTKRLKQKG